MDFLDGTVDESSCQCVGHGSDPRSQKIPHAAAQLSLCATITEPVLWSPYATASEACVSRACALQKKSPQ